VNDIHRIETAHTECDARQRRRLRSIAVASMARSTASDLVVSALLLRRSNKPPRKPPKPRNVPLTSRSANMPSKVCRDSTVLARSTSCDTDFPCFCSLFHAFLLLQHKVSVVFFLVNAILYYATRA
jgi:hypothetical protein